MAKVATILNPLHLLTLLTCLIIFIFLMVLSLKIYYREYEEDKEKGKGKDSAVSPVGMTCNSNDCVTNIQTGIKRCPADERPEPYDHTTETCNPPFSCTSSRTPYAVGIDGETLGSNCSPGMSCNCSSRLQCPLDRVTVFMINDREQDQRVIPVRNDGYLKPPMGYTVLCQIPSVLSEKGLGCKVTKREDLYRCFSGKLGKKACPYGVVAVHMPKTGYVSTGYTLSCIQQNPCGSKAVKYYDPKSKKRFCLEQNQTCTAMP